MRPLKSKPPLDAFTRSHASLSPILLILSAFAHRNHNQHRASHWWSVFNIFRRALRRLDALLVKNQHDVVRESSSWMSSHVVPRAYVAFTQLAADNQHASLGLMLLTLLARVNTVLSDLVPSKPSPKRVAAVTSPPLETPLSLSLEPSGTDRGIIISRRELATAAKRGAPDKPQVPDESSKLTRGNEFSEGVMAKREPYGNKAKDRQAADTQKEDRNEDKRKKKRKKKGGDELSSLFGSLT